MFNIGVTHARPGKPFPIARVLAAVAMVAVATAAIAIGLRVSDNDNGRTGQVGSALPPIRAASSAYDVPVSGILYVVDSQEEADLVQQNEHAREAQYFAENGHSQNRWVSVAVVTTPEERAEMLGLGELAALEQGALGHSYEIVDLSVR